MPLRLHIIAEGQTEARFVKDVLAPYLGTQMVWADARCVLTSKDRWTGVAHRGGFRRRSSYATVKSAYPFCGNSVRIFPHGWIG